MRPVTDRKSLPALPFRRYRAAPRLVVAVQLTAPEDVANPFAAEGAFHGEPGDWRICYGRNPDGTENVAICAKHVFDRSYERVAGDNFRKRSSVVIEAAQLQEPLDIVTLEGPSHGEAGDWLLIAHTGEPYFNSDACFRKGYIAADEQAS